MTDSDPAVKIPPSLPPSQKMPTGAVSWILSVLLVLIYNSATMSLLRGAWMRAWQRGEPALIPQIAIYVVLTYIAVAHFRKRYGAAARYVIPLAVLGALLGAVSAAVLRAT